MCVRERVCAGPRPRLRAFVRPMFACICAGDLARIREQQAEVVVCDRVLRIDADHIAVFALGTIPVLAHLHCVVLYWAALRKLRRRRVQWCQPFLQHEDQPSLSQNRHMHEAMGPYGHVPQMTAPQANINRWCTTKSRPPRLLCAFASSWSSRIASRNSCSCMGVARVCVRLCACMCSAYSAVVVAAGVL